VPGTREGELSQTRLSGLCCRGICFRGALPLLVLSVLALGSAALPLSAQTAASKAAPASAPTLASARSELLALKDRGPSFASRLESYSQQLEAADYLSLLSEFAPLAAEGTASKALLIEAGDLALLLGRYDTAAQNFEAAAFRLPPGRDDTLLLKACRAYLVSGETGRASDRAGLILRSGGPAGLLRGAQLVLAWASLISGSNDSALASASAILKGGQGLDAAAAKSAERREALFISWASAQAAARPPFAAALAKEYPQSPEASLAAGGSGGSAVQFLPLPHWYLSGLIQQTAVPSAPGTAAAAAPGSADTPVPAQSSQQGEGSASSSAASSKDQPEYYQIGIFSKEDNASALLAELTKKGFSARIETRQANGRELKAVLVAAGSDPQATLLKLKDAGYEACPLF